MILQPGNSLSSQSMLYYCNRVLSNSIDSGTARQILVNMIGQAPMGLAWRSSGSLIVLLAKDSMPVVLSGLFIKSIGTLPTYVTAALLAEALDHAERKNGFAQMVSRHP